MITDKPTHFALPFFKDKYVIGFCDGGWFWFYDYFICGADNIKEINLSSAKVLFLNFIGDTEKLDGIVYLKGNQIIETLEIESDVQKEIFFDENEHAFKTIKEENTTPSTFEESLSYVDIIASQNCSTENLKLRILELYLGFVPNFQYEIELTYKSFFQTVIAAINTQDDSFTRMVRQKTFDEIFDKTIVPFGEKHGFKRHTKTSKRLFKEFNNGISIFLFFEYKRFGHGSYEASVVYFDKDIGNFENDRYLSRVAPNFPYASNLMIECQNKEILIFEIDSWMRIMELYMFPFIAENVTHKCILNTIENKIKIDEYREELGVARMKRKPIYYFELPFSSTCKKELLDKNEKYISLLKAKAKMTANTN